MASREKELSALHQISDPPRSRLSELLGRLIYPFLRGEPPEGPSGYRLLHGHHRMHRLQGLRGGVQAVEPTALGWL